MEPADAVTPERADTDQSPSGNGAALDDLRDPLSVILGRTQLLERRILNGETISPDDYLSLLSQIQRSVWDIEKTLRAMQACAERMP